MVGGNTKHEKLDIAIEERLLSVSGRDFWIECTVSFLRDTNLPILRLVSLSYIVVLLLMVPAVETHIGSQIQSTALEYGRKVMIKTR